MLQWVIEAESSLQSQSCCCFRFFFSRTVGVFLWLGLPWPLVVAGVGSRALFRTLTSVHAGFNTLVGDENWKTFAVVHVKKREV